MTEPSPPPALVVFDMDRTLIDGRVAITWSRNVGVEDDVRKIIKERHDGAIDGIESARRIAALWKGQSLDELGGLVEKIPLNPGAVEAVTALREQGVATAVLTDSYVQAAEIIRRRIGADYALGLVLEEKDGRLTGEIRPPPEVPEGEAGCEHSFLCKEAAVRALADRFGARLERTVMVGDSDPDACAMAVTGVGIAYRVRGTRVPEVATHTIEGKDLREVLAILGVPGVKKNA